MSVSKNFESVYRASIEQPEAFWREQTDLIEWSKPFDTVCDYSNPPFAKWFVGGETNLCHHTTRGGAGPFCAGVGGVGASTPR